MQKNKDNNKIKSFDGVIPKVLDQNKSELLPKITHTNGIFSSGLKITSAVLLSLFLLVSLTNLGSTVSYYRNVEKSIGNFLQADPLSFTVKVGEETSVQLDISQTSNSITPIMMPDEDSEPIQYFVNANFVSGDQSLCESIHAQTTFPFPYDGPLLALKTATSTDVGAWTLNLSLNAIANPNTSCTIELIYKGWNAGSEEGRGYRDEKKILITLFVPDVAQKDATVQVLEVVDVNSVVEPQSESTTTEPTIEEVKVLPDPVVPEAVVEQTVPEVTNETVPSETPPAQ